MIIVKVGAGKIARKRGQLRQVSGEIDEESIKPLDRQCLAMGLDPGDLRFKTGYLALQLPALKLEVGES